MTLLSEASFLVTPNGYKASKLYAAIPTNGNGDMTFTRATTATRVDENDLVSSVASNVPRIDYTGGGCPSILVEPQRTNLVTYSNDTTNASWNKFFNSNALISPSVISPDGSLNTNVLSFDGTTNGQLSKNVSGLTIGVSYTLSFYSKTRTGSSDLAYKILGMTNFPLLSNTSWVRNTLTFTATATSHIFLIFSNQVGSIELFGFQLEEGAYPTSYIPTTTASVTRLVDSCHLLNHSLFTDYPFTVYANAEVDAVSNTIFSLNNTSSQNYYLAFYFANSTQVGLVRRDLSNNDSDFYNFSYSAGDTIKVAVAFISPTAYKLYINGAEIANVTSGTSIPFNHNDISLGQLRITGDTGTRNSINEFMVFNKVLSDSELQTLTTL
jgi:hypothetical protein